MAQLVVRLPGRHEVVGSNRADALHFWRKVSRCLTGLSFKLGNNHDQSVFCRKLLETLRKRQQVPRKPL